MPEGKRMLIRKQDQFIFYAQRFLYLINELDFNINHVLINLFSYLAHLIFKLN